jgi:hypothetical protein
MSDIQIIDVLLVADTAAILEKYGSAGTPSKPTYLDENLIWLIVRQKQAIFANASAELKLAARTEDIIRWRATSLSHNAENSALFYAFQPMRPGTDKLIRTPRANLVELKTPLPDPDAPAKPTMQQVQDYFWQTTVLSAGEAVYTFDFTIVHRDGTVHGYFSWDPFIKISD